MRSRLVFPLLLFSLAASACSDDLPPEEVGGASATSRKMEDFCSIKGLAAPVRETVLVIDQSSLVTSSPEEFRLKNPKLIEVLQGLSNNSRAVETGAMAPRERLSIVGVNPKSGAVNKVFSGCLPGFSADELAGRAASGSDSALDKYMGSDLASEAREYGENFSKFALIAALSVKPAPKAQQDQSGAGLLRLIKLLASQPGETPRRIFLYTDPSRDLRQLPEGYEEARKAAFALARSNPVSMGLAEVHVVPAGRDVTATQTAFMDALFLGSGADLRSAAPFSADKLLPAAQKNYAFSGQMPVGDGVSVPVDIYLRVTRDGSLVNSWVSYTGGAGLWSTPLSGDFNCIDEGECTLKGDPQAGFGQRWRTLPGSEPQGLADAPFGGMRIVEGQVRGGTFNVRISDPIIKVITDNSGSTDIKFSAKAAE